MSNFDLRDAQVVTSDQLVTAPDAVRPHFKWNVQVPLDWMYLVTNPEQQARGIDNITRDLLGSKEIDPHGIEEFARALSKIIDKIRENKTLLTFIFPIISSENKTSMSMLSLRWHDFSPAMAPILPVHGSETTINMNFQYCTSKNGVNYALTTDSTNDSNGALVTDPVSYHTFVPVPGTSWACQILGSTPSSIFQERMRTVVIRMTESLRFYPNQSEQLAARKVGE